MIQIILATALLFSPAPISSQDGATSLFPPASGSLPMELGPDAPVITYLQLVRAYGELTGVHFSYDQETETLLEGTTVRVDRNLTVDAENVPLFVESMLVRANFALRVMSTEGVRIADVVSLQTVARNNIRSGAIRIPGDRIDIARAHPAVIFTTTVEMNNSDVRQLSNAMRTMITDANTQQLLPAGTSNSVVIVGFGRNLADLADLLREIDRAAGEARAPRRDFRIIALANAEAPTLAGLLSTLTAPANQQMATDGPPMRDVPLRIVPDQRTNSILLAGKAEDLDAIAKLIAQLDA
ncbi:MAG: secretin N-terminal domain-containing protein [Planctomycetota bacterium]